MSAWEQLVNECTANCDLLYSNIRQKFNNVSLIVQHFVTLFTAISHWLTILNNWLYRYLFLSEQQYVSERTGICDFLYSKIVTDGVAFSDCLYSNMLLNYSNICPNVQKFVTDSTAISDWLYSNMGRTVQQLVTLRKTICNWLNNNMNLTVGQ